MNWIRTVGQGTKKRLVITSALWSILVLTPLTYVADASGGHPAKSAPVVLWVAWLLILVTVRLLIRRMRRLSTRRRERLLGRRDT